jgi:hypothetical protein
MLLSRHCQVTDLLPVGCLIIVGDQACHRRVVRKLDDGVGVMRDLAVVGRNQMESNVKSAVGIGLQCYAKTGYSSSTMRMCVVW